MFRRKHIFISIVLLILSVMAMYNYMYKSHRDIATEVPDFSMESKALGADFLKDTGKVTEIESDNFTLDQLIVCYADSTTIKEVQINSNVYVKGRSIGYDELLGLVKLDQISIIHH